MSIMRFEAGADMRSKPSLPEIAPKNDILTVADVAFLLRVGRGAIYEAVARNQIPHRRIGKQIRFSRGALLEWLDARQGRMK